MKYSIILPTYNESENIQETLRKLAQYCPESTEVIVVDDNSPDGTAKIAEQVATAINIPVHVLKNPGVRGLSPSVIFGFNHASGAYLACMDADGQHRPEDLPGLLETMERQDAIFMIGSRHVPGGGFTEHWSLSRTLASRSAAIAARICLGVPIQDPMSGFFVIRRDIFQFVKDELSPSGFKIMLELAWLLHIAGLQPIEEYPITFAMRKFGKSKLSAQVIQQYIGMLLRCMRTKASIQKKLKQRLEQSTSNL